jgi:hypothetical protein
MPSTYTLISSNVLTTTAASVTFSAIPSTYTDLVLRSSVRIQGDGGTNDYGRTKWQVVINGSSTHSRTTLYGNGASAISERATTEGVLVPSGVTESENATTNTFASGELYLPNYTSTTNKPISSFGTSEQNGTTAFASVGAHLFQTSTGISSIQIYSNFGNHASGSSFYLYGIKSS